MTIGSKIKELRLQKGMNQKDLAKKAGISNTYLSDIEHQRTNPSIKTLSKIAEALEIDFDWDVFLKSHYVNNEQNNVQSNVQSNS